MAIEIYEEYSEKPVKNGEKKTEQFVQKILPGIYERTKESGHFQNMKTHEPISLSEMSDDTKEDSSMYQKFIKKLQNLLLRSEKSPHLIGEFDAEDIHKMFGSYGKGRGEGNTHYFVEYLKNKSSILAAAIELTLDKHISHERLAKEIQKILSELTGEKIESRKKVVSM